jgi:hypothetical protein
LAAIAEYKIYAANFPTSRLFLFYLYSKPQNITISTPSLKENKYFKIKKFNPLKLEKKCADK